MSLVSLEKPQSKIHNMDNGDWFTREQEQSMLIKAGDELVAALNALKDDGDAPQVLAAHEAIRKWQEVKKVI